MIISFIDWTHCSEVYFPPSRMSFRKKKLWRASLNITPANHIYIFWLIDMDPSLDFVFSKLLQYGEFDNQTVGNLLNPIWLMNHNPWLDIFQFTHGNWNLLRFYGYFKIQWLTTKNWCGKLVNFFQCIRKKLKKCCQELVRHEATKGSFIEFIGYWMLPPN